LDVSGRIRALGEGVGEGGVERLGGDGHAVAGVSTGGSWGYTDL
jgi:hypothetical protein